MSRPLILSAESLPSSKWQSTTHKSAPTDWNKGMPG